MKPEDNKEFQRQTKVAQIILGDTDKQTLEIINNCMAIMFLEGAKVGLEEAKKIYGQV